MLLEQPSAPGYRFLTGSGQTRDVNAGEPVLDEKLTLRARIWYEVRTVVLTSFSFVQQQPSHFCDFPPLVLACGG
jgi:hypothetical protein